MNFDLERLKIAIKEQGRTREWLCDKTGVRRHHMSRILNGHSVPSLSVIKLFSLHLGIPEKELRGQARHSA